MNKILTINQAIKISEKIRKKGKKIVLTGGCFDILHIGHIAYLTNAKKQGEILMVLLESDETIRNTKGENRPIHTQEQRATILATLSVVDYIVFLPPMKEDKNYDELVFSLKPAIIVGTKADPKRIHKERQAKVIHAQLIDVVERITDTSTSKLAEFLNKNL